MLFRLVRPMKRKGTQNRHYERRIPSDVRHLAVGLRLSIPVGDEFRSVTISGRTQLVRVSLRTADPAEVKRRLAQVDEYLERLWWHLRADQPISLTHEQATALAGDFYRAWASTAVRSTVVEEVNGTMVVVEHESEDARQELWAALADRVGDAREAVEFDPETRKWMEDYLGPIIRLSLIRKGLTRVDEASWWRLVEAFARAAMDAFRKQQRNAAGDYRADLNADRFPEWRPPTPSVPSVQPNRKPDPGPPKVTITGLLEAWWLEAKARRLKASTYESYRTAVNLLVAAVGHDDAIRVTADDILAFKDQRIADGISPKTVNDSNLSALKGLFGWAVRNRKLSANPAKDVGVKSVKTPRLRSKGFTDEEALTILQHAMTHTQGPTEAWQIAMAKRWVPWLCAFTGARVGEMIQLRKEDVRQHGDAWIVRITPEAGTVKDNEAREVPLHPQLVEAGFIRFLQHAPTGHLFMVVAGDGEEAWRAGWRTAKNRVREFVRDVFTDDGVLPSHAWRHRFKTIGRGLKIDSFTLHALQGHAAENVGDTYGEVPLETRISAINAFPRIALEAPPFDPSKLRWGRTGKARRPIGG